MKRTALTLASLFLIFGLTLTACPTDTPTPPPPNGGEENPNSGGEDPAVLIDGEGYLDLTGFDGYSAADEGIVFDPVPTGIYAEFFVITLADIEDVDAFTKAELVADIYNASGIIDISSVWSARIQGKADGVDPASNNMGTLGQFLDFTASTTTLNFYTKEDPVTKIVIKGVKFSN